MLLSSISGVPREKWATRSGRLPSLPSSTGESVLQAGEDHLGHLAFECHGAVR